MAPAKKGGKKKAQSTIDKVVTRKYTINLHKSFHRGAFRKRAPRVFKGILQFVMEEVGAPGVCSDTRTNKAAGPKEQGTCCVRLSEDVTKTHHTSSVCWLHGIK